MTYICWRHACTIRVKARTTHFLSVGLSSMTKVSQRHAYLRLLFTATLLLLQSQADTFVMLSFIDSQVRVRIGQSGSYTYITVSITLRGWLVLLAAETTFSKKSCIIRHEYDPSMYLGTCRIRRYWTRWNVRDLAHEDGGPLAQTESQRMRTEDFVKPLLLCIFAASAKHFHFQANVAIHTYVQNICCYQTSAQDDTNNNLWSFWYQTFSVPAKYFESRLEDISLGQVLPRNLFSHRYICYIGFQLSLNYL